MSAYLAYVAALVGLLALVAVGLRWRLGALRPARGAGRTRRLLLVEDLGMGPGQRLAIVRCDGCDYLLGQSGHEFVLLDRLAPAAQVALAAAGTAPGQGVAGAGRSGGGAA